jgi:hypothetical protein
MGGRSHMGGFQPFGDRDAMARMRKKRTLRMGEAIYQIDL